MHAPHDFFVRRLHCEVYFPCDVCIAPDQFIVECNGQPYWDSNVISSDFITRLPAKPLQMASLINSYSMFIVTWRFTMEWSFMVVFTHPILISFSMSLQSMHACWLLRTILTLHAQPLRKSPWSVQHTNDNIKMREGKRNYKNGADDYDQMWGNGDVAARNGAWLQLDAEMWLIKMKMQMSCTSKVIGNGKLHQTKLSSWKLFSLLVIADVEMPPKPEDPWVAGDWSFNCWSRPCGCWLLVFVAWQTEHDSQNVFTSVPNVTHQKYWCT